MEFFKKFINWFRSKLLSMFRRWRSVVAIENIDIVTLDNEFSPTLKMIFIFPKQDHVRSVNKLLYICFTERVTEDDDIQIRFSEQKGNKVVWECFEKPVWYNNNDIHMISVRCPVYRLLNIDEPRIIHLQARRLSDGAISSAEPFKFLPFISRFEIVDYYPKFRIDDERFIEDGHYWQVVVFSELINIYDIQVCFFEEINGEVVWEEFADIDYNTVNHTPKISVMCPNYKSLEIDVPIETYIQCIRLSDGAKSTPVTFTFYPFKAKKPFPLKRICKRKIRHIIGKDQVEECINGLELPQELKIYLLQRTHNN